MGRRAEAARLLLRLSSRRGLLNHHQHPSLSAFCSGASSPRPPLAWRGNDDDHYRKLISTLGAAAEAAASPDRPISYCQHIRSFASSAAPPPKERDDDAPPPPPLVLYRGKWILPVRLLVRAKIFQLAGFGSVAAACSLAAAGDLTPTDAALLAALTAGCVGSAFSLWFYSSRYVGELALLLSSPAKGQEEDGDDGNKTRLRVRVSSLDFWGNRADAAFDARRLRPLVRAGGRTRADEVERLTSQLLFPINVVPSAEAGVVGDDDDDDDDDEEEEEEREQRGSSSGDSGAQRRAAPLPPGERRQFYLSAVAGASPHPRLLMALLDGSLVAARPWERARTAEELERAVFGSGGEKDEAAAADDGGGDADDGARRLRR